MGNVTLLKNLYDAFGRGDIPAVTRFQEYVDTAKLHDVMASP